MEKLGLSYDLSCAEVFYREDYIEHKHGEKAKNFAELIHALGEPIDDEELDMLADRVHEIILRRMDMLEKLEKLCAKEEQINSEE